MRKTMLAMVMALAMVLGALPALGEAMDPPAACVTRIQSGDSVDLDGDGSAEAIEFAFPNGNEYDSGDVFTLSIGGSEIRYDGACCLTGNAYALRLGNKDTYILLDEYGPSDDPCTYVYALEDGNAIFCGSFACAVDTMRVGQDGFSALIRANALYTWYREADFTFARGYFYQEENPDQFWSAPQVVEVPRALYPMACAVTLKVDLPVTRSITDDAVVRVLPAGTKGILCATDDVSVVCIEAQVRVDDSDYVSRERCWFKLGEYGSDVIVDGDTVSSWDVFDGLLFAD